MEKTGVIYTSEIKCCTLVLTNINEIKINIVKSNQPNESNHSQVCLNFNNNLKAVLVKRKYFVVITILFIQIRSLATESLKPISHEHRGRIEEEITKIKCLVIFLFYTIYKRAKKRAQLPVHASSLAY